MNEVPEQIDPRPWLAAARGGARREDAMRALASDEPGPRELAALLSPAAGALLEPMARRAQALTRRHFGRTVQLYVPLYLSSHCPGGCLYCGFASDRAAPRHRLEPEQSEDEMDALKSMGFEEVLLLTGERCPGADYAYVRDCVARAARHFHNVNVEVFPMETGEYRGLAEAGCSGLTLYQETYDPGRYERFHRWGPKRDYRARLDAPERALRAGLRFAGLGALLGLSDPRYDLLALYRHAAALRKQYWRSGISISFPRIRDQEGGFRPDFPVSDRELAQFIYAFRLCLPDVPLVLSTRERPALRDGMAGVGISKMSVASRTTVGGYSGRTQYSEGQFEVSDGRGIDEFCAMLRAANLEPVFKNWEAVYR
ncbi:2-iminoacetate synthase ThiH [Kiritimatiella glycovorans]|uniref:2-iminoacetate synthase n=1 Tax=Kiritimatiella glycovorans TaxID=1307763 RepID=A0A0G3EHS8_9BACT|nr:2-iminoacetate synthase ThiH [Kiritimatiella glycovorans]AKJ64977.1 2-iminoacetate synthase [Kiritimatiella glycovorans]